MNIKDELLLYIEENLKQEKTNILGAFKKAKLSYDFFECESSISEVDNYLEKEKNENNFQKLLFQYIDSRELKDSDVYNKVNMDRRLFSKIRNDQDYHPSKETVILLSLALNLEENELLKLLDSASYSLPKNNIFDLIIRFCFIKKIYDVNRVNELLFEYKCKTLN